MPFRCARIPTEMSETNITIEEFERGLHELTPLEAKCKAMLKQKLGGGQDLAKRIAQAKRDLVAEGYALYAERYDPVDIQDGFISFTDRFDISAIYQSRYLPVHAHVHDFIEAVFVYHGRCDLVTDEGTTRLDKGNLVIVSPAYRHDHCVMDDESIILLIAIRCDTFNNAFFGMLEHKDIISDFFLATLYDSRIQKGLLFCTGNDKRISDTILEMHYERTIEHEYCGEMLASLLGRLLVLLLRNYKDRVEIVDAAGPVGNPRLVPILRDIQANYRDSSLQSLAGKYGHSESSLSRLIKNGTGKTYKCLVREIRAKAAGKMLANPKLSIHEIADLVGYCDTSHFYKDFQWFYKVTPGQYRQRLDASPRGPGNTGLPEDPHPRSS